MPKRNKKEERAYVDSLCSLADEHAKTVTARLNNLERTAFADSCDYAALATIANAHRKSLVSHKKCIELLLAERQSRLNRKWWQFWRIKES